MRRIGIAWWGAGAVILIAVAIVIGLRWRTTDTIAQERGTSNEEAWLAFERARFGDNAGRVQIETGIRYYQQAIQLDPPFARAWAGLATAHMALTWFGERPLADTMMEARRVAEEATAARPIAGTTMVRARVGQPLRRLGSQSSRESVSTRHRVDP